MQKLIIEGGYPLTGTIRISGAKNAVLKLMAAALLGKGKFVIRDVPAIKDVYTMIGVLTALGVKAELTDSVLTLEVDQITGEAPTDLVQEMRASIQVMGPLLARLGWVKIAKPGGCAIGDRPIDLHLRNLERLGAVIEEEHGFITARCSRLIGQEISLDFPSVGATENLMMAATLAKGKTVIYNAAREPEIVDIQNFLNQMGAKIYGAGTSVIVIEGIDEKHLGGAEYTVIPDRIEAGTYLLAAAITRGNITLENVNPQHIQVLLSKLTETNSRLSIGLNKITLESGRIIQPANIITLPYPGFATDLQPQFMSLVTLANGSSVIKETVYSRRFGHVEELRRMGADIQLDTNSAIVRGVKQLSGAAVRAMDLRAGAALVIAGLAAHGTTEITGVEHIMRGYEKLVEKLQGVGAKINLVSEEGN